MQENKNGHFNWQDAKLTQNIKKAIDEAEEKTSCEIRVHIELNNQDDISMKALFTELNMNKTRYGNGLFVAARFHKSQFSHLSVFSCPH